MALGDFAGHAKLNVKDPSAQGECDRCGMWYQLDMLSKQMQWQGVSLIWTGNLVCPKCNDIPFEQQKVLILPPDPKPRINPRPSREQTPTYYSGFTPPNSFDNQGMTSFLLGQGGTQPLGGAEPGNYTISKTAVLANVATLSGVPTPVPISDQSIILQRNAPQTGLAVNLTRTWMLIYNPTQYVAEFALGPTTWNGTSNLSIGPGQAWFWSNVQALTQVYTGVVSAVGQFANIPLWFWDSSSGGIGNDGGVAFIAFPPPSFPTSPTGLVAGAVYLVPNILPGNEFAIGVVPGIVPNPLAPPVYQYSISPLGLVSLGGGNLPLTKPASGSLQLWNNGNLISVA